MSGTLRFSTALQIFNAYPIAREDIEAEPTDDHPLIFLDMLAASSTPEDAISLCAYMLPKREAVWWACQCLRSTDPNLTPNDENAIQLAELWVREPEEENRYEALNAGMNALNKTAAIWIALAAGWSGGSMTEETQPTVTPPNFLTGQSVRAAVLTTLTKIERTDRSNQLQMFIKGAKKLIGSEAGPK